MYRRRRLTVLLVLLLIIAGVALAVWQPWRASGGTGATPGATPAAPPTSAGATPAGEATPSAEESPEATASEDPEPEKTDAASPDPSATLAVCTSRDVIVTAVTDRQSYGAAEKPELSIRLVNEGDVECVMNVGTAAQSFVVASGSDTWWRSTDCQTASSDQLVTLEPGREVTSVQPLVWDRTRSGADTCDKDRPKAGSGYYNLTVTVGGIESEPRQFQLR